MQKPKEWFTDVGFFLLGGIIYAVAVNIFTVPANIAPGGATGLSVLLNHMTEVPIGTSILLLNLPLFFLSLGKLGREFLLKTLIATAVFSCFIDITAPWFPAYHGSRLLAALYGGVLSGLGLTLVLLRGATTGGTDIAAKLLVKRFPILRLAPVIMGLDGVIIVLSALVYNNIDSGLYACLMIFTATTIMDRLLYNAGMGKLAYIITCRGNEVAQAILWELGRGCTLLPAQGAYSKQQKHVLLCVTRRNEVWRLQRLVKQTDAAAFVTVCDAGQVLGEGFSTLN